MRNTTLHTICILGLALLSSVSHAELDPNMEAAVDCSTSNCMFQGNSQASDALRGLSKLPVQAKLQKINEFKSNPSQDVSLNEYPQFAPVGELHSLEKLADGRFHDIKGSSVLVSPCYALTAYHVAFREEKRIEGKDYSMTFSLGQGSEEGGFGGFTDAKPVIWGDYDGQNNDWALVRLHSCAGAVDQIGWAEPTAKSAAELAAQHTQVAVVGYSANGQRNQLSASVGKVVGKNPDNSLLMVNASMSQKQSGGALFTKEGGLMKLAGLVSYGYEEGGRNSFESFANSHANNSTSAFEILNRSDVKAMLDADKAQFGKPNPANARNSRPLPSPKTQMASI